ncbi:hypothetical protein [Gemmatimonas aurantiaca]|uniref:hypothetical protein n=1 Tax=Gemmatimonas aurantiaca TaxID=173480 RepID=UPI00301D8FAF
MMPSQTHTHRHRRLANERRGAALLTVLIVSIVAVTLALTSSMLVMSNTLVQNSSERAAMLDDAALSGLEEARNRLNAALDTVPLAGYIALENDVAITGGNGITRSTWVGRIGNADSLANAGEYGVQAEIVSRAKDAAGNSTIRRSLVYQSSFARYAYFTDKGKMANGTTLWIALGETYAGPFHSNDSIYIYTLAYPQGIFKDVVTTATGVYNASNARWDKGPATKIAPIALPGTADLNLVKTIATKAGYVFTPAVVTGDSALVTMRIEFVAIDVDGDGNVTGPDEGFFRVYRTKATNPYGHGYAAARTMAPPAGARGPLDSLLYSPNCGVVTTVGGVTSMTTSLRGIPEGGTGNYRDRMKQKQDAFDDLNARCFLGGDPRLTPTGVFTPTDSAGEWLPRTSGTVPAVVAARPDGAYLWPLSPNYNPNFRGTIFVEGRVGVSGVVRGRVTLASRNATIVLSDLTQATSPATTSGTCRPDDDIIGLFAGDYILFADNTLQSPQQRRSNDSTSWRLPRKDFDPSPGRPDLAVHAVTLGIQSVATERPGPPSGLGTAYWVNRGTIRQVGGRINKQASPSGTMSGTVLHGYHEDVSFNRCAMSYPPPYFPTTGRWTLSQYYELDPQGFDIGDWFARR